MAYVGQNKLREIYCGEIPISRVYKGNTKVFEKKFYGTILLVHAWMPAADVDCPHSIANIFESTGKRTYEWRKTIPEGTHTFRFNTSGEPIEFTRYVSEDLTLAKTWSKGSMHTDLYISTTQLQLVYSYEYKKVASDSATYPRYANKYITTVEII